MELRDENESRAARCDFANQLPVSPQLGVYISWHRAGASIGPPILIPCFKQYAAFSTYFAAHNFNSARSFPVNSRTTFAGAPSTTEPGGIFIPCVTSAFAPMSDCLPTTTPSRITAPMPTSTSSPTVQACTTAEWPTVTQLPTMHGKSSARCSTALS